ncbi:MAG: chaperonin GroEL [Planctomycetota bacterium]|nr:chaperonin GroEL [Planctomycetota bacterium]MDI6787320.1 chaperonin GroEL [Planctomycetota bacterium]
MSKQVIFDNAGREKILKGSQSMADILKITLGPTGHNVLIEKSFGSPEIIKDGNIISKEVELEDPFENMGAKMVAEAASKTAEEVGDGTALTAILTHSIYEDGLKYITAGHSSTSLKKGIDQATDTVVQTLKKNSIPVKTKDDYLHIATIAANHNETIGKHIASAIDKVGKEGIITVEESKGREITVEYAEGLSFDKGYISPYFITNIDDLTCVLEKPYILLYEKKITNARELLPLLEQVVPTGSPLLIIAEEIEGEALTLLVLNKLQGILKCGAVKAPAFGDRKKSIMEDISIISGGTFFCEEMGIKLESITISQLGRAKKVKIEKENTFIIQGYGDKTKISERLNQIRNQIKTITSEYDREKLEERLAKLSGGVAVIEVGATTETEQKDKKALVENAVHSAQAARDEGYLPGGGSAYLSTLPELQKLFNQTTDPTEKMGIKIVMSAIQLPLKQIGINSGTDGSYITEDVKEKQIANKNIGYDAVRKHFVDMLSAGIIDPTKLLRIALQNAASTAGMMLSARTFLSDIKEEKKHK